VRQTSRSFRSRARPISGGARSRPRRGDELASWQADQLKDAQAKVDELAKALDAERQPRQALEGVLADLRKGS
jgi:uncharacterized membrane protein